MMKMKMLEAKGYIKGRKVDIVAVAVGRLVCFCIGA